MSYFQDVVRFHRDVCGDAPVAEPTEPAQARMILRSKIMHEEWEELLDAMDMSDIAGVAKEGADLIVTVLGTMDAYGIPFDAVWDAVHASNMAKKDGPVRADGKILKPPGWQKPDIERILWP